MTIISFCSQTTEVLRLFEYCSSWQFDSKTDGKREGKKGQLPLAAMTKMCLFSHGLQCTSQGFPWDSSPAKFSELWPSDSIHPFLNSVLHEPHHQVTSICHLWRCALFFGRGFLNATGCPPYSVQLRLGNQSQRKYVLCGQSGTPCGDS